jgi:hypothetical protein
MARAQVLPGEAEAMTPDEHAQAFMAFVAGLMSEFDRYLARGKPDPLHDGVGYRAAAMWLTDDEFREFGREVAKLLAPRLANAPAPGRRRRLLYTVLLPGDEKQANADQPSGDDGA